MASSEGFLVHVNSPLWVFCRERAAFERLLPWLVDFSASVKATLDGRLWKHTYADTSEETISAHDMIRSLPLSTLFNNVFSHQVTLDFKNWKSISTADLIVATRFLSLFKQRQEALLRGQDPETDPSSGMTNSVLDSPLLLLEPWTIAPPQARAIDYGTRERPLTIRLVACGMLGILYDDSCGVELGSSHLWVSYNSRYFRKHHAELRRRMPRPEEWKLFERSTGDFCVRLRSLDAMTDLYQEYQDARVKLLALHGDDSQVLPWKEIKTSP